jgi:hypothetical protein
MYSVLPWSASTTTQPKKPPLGLKSFESDHEIMQNVIICLNLVKNVGAPAVLGRTLHVEFTKFWEISWN